MHKDMREQKDAEKTIELAFEQHYDALFRYCLACLDGDEQAAMDAVENVFIITKEKAEVFEAVKDSKRWLFTTARNTVRNIQRSRRSYRRRYVLFEPAVLSASRFGDGTPLKAWEKKLASVFSAEDEALAETEIPDEEIESIKELLLESLNEDERRLVIARFQEGVSTDELSKRLGISKDAVCMRIARISIKLTERIEIYFENQRSF